MTDQTKDRTAAEAIAAALTAAWNSADGEAFAGQFAADADFVNIFGMHVVGRDEIEKLHQQIFDTIYLGSHNEFTVDEVRALCDHTAVAHVRANLEVPSGPLAGKVVTLATAVITRQGHTWQIAAFQNTREQPPPGPIAQFE